MAEYIEREALRDELLNISIDISNLYNCGILEGLDRATKRLNEQPAADVTPVRHGRWETMHYVGGILDGTNFDKCSVCGYKRIFEDEKLKTAFKYCPNCGAKMDGTERS